MRTLALMLPHFIRAILLRMPPVQAAWRYLMTKRQYGMIATMAGAAMAAAWWWRRRDSIAEGMSEAGHSRGELIYTNSPTVSAG